MTVKESWRLKGNVSDSGARARLEGGGGLIVKLKTNNAWRFNISLASRRLQMIDDSPKGSTREVGYIGDAELPRRDSKRRSYSRLNGAFSRRKKEGEKQKEKKINAVAESDISGLK